MASLNRTMLIGNVGADPVVRYMPDGTPTASVSIATTESWKDKTTGESMQRTEWHRVVFFRGLAQVVADYLKKGSQIYVEGPARTRKWTDRDGIDRYITEIVGREMKMLGKKSADQVPDAPTGDEPPTPDADETGTDIPF